MLWEGYWSSDFGNLEQENTWALLCNLPFSFLSWCSRISARLFGATVLGGSVRPNSCQLQKALPVALIWWLNTCFCVCVCVKGKVGWVITLTGFVTSRMASHDWHENPFTSICFFYPLPLRPFKWSYLFLQDVSNLYFFLNTPSIREVELPFNHSILR